MPKGNQGEARTRATQNRLKMYDSKAKRDKKGKIIYQAFKSKDVSHEARIQPDRRWFGNTRSVNQEELSRFREEVEKKLNSPGTYVLKPGKVPFSLLKDQKPVRPLLFAPFSAPKAIRLALSRGIGYFPISSILNEDLSIGRQRASARIRNFSPFDLNLTILLTLAPVGQKTHHTGCTVVCRYLWQKEHTKETALIVYRC